MTEDNAMGLEILIEVAKISNSTQDLQVILNKTINVVTDKLHIDGCAIYLIDEDDPGPQIKLTASIGLPHEGASRVALDLGKGVTGWVAKNKTTLALDKASLDPRFIYFPEIEEEKFQSMLSAPMLIQDRCIGVINVHTFEERQFSQMEISILETISNQMTGCIRNAFEYHKSQRLLKEQTILYEISQAVQASFNLENRLWIILRGITMGQAGGFNRAILFLIDEKEQLLKGVMGLGPNSQEEANRIWSELAGKEDNTYNLNLTEADRNAYKNSSFNEYSGKLSFSIEPGENILAETVIQNQPFNITDAQKHPLAPADFLESLGVNAFAAVPLATHQGVLGVLLVDNRYNGETITEAKLKLLTQIATQGSWVIENSRLFNKLLESNRELLSTKEQLIQSEKLAALGELSAEVAHEIKNPLVSIGGFARRLMEKAQTISLANEEDIKATIDYSNIIMTEVGRLETLLKNILSYSSAEKLDLVKCEMNCIVKEVIESFEPVLYEKNVKINYDPADNQYEIYLDRFKIKQVLTNIFFNAIESMPNGGTIKITTCIEKFSDGREMVLIKAEDDGGGIPQETFANIFNPFFTTKDSGTGLGLSISRRIVESHNGKIHVENNINKGVTVYVYLPLQKPAEYNNNLKPSS